MIAAGGVAGAAMSYLLHGGTVISATAHDNYIVARAAWGTLYPRTFAGWSISNNVDMISGNIIQAYNNSEVPATTVRRILGPNQRLQSPK